MAIATCAVTLMINLLDFENQKNKNDPDYQPDLYYFWDAPYRGGLLLAGRFP